MNDVQASAGHIASDIGTIFKPPRRVAVSDAVEKSVMIATPGGYAGKWAGDQTPYMVAAMDLISSRDFSTVVFVAPARTGKALALNTPIATPTGWTTMGQIQVGDWIFGDDGKPVEVDYVTDPMFAHDCYRVTFNDKTSIVADGDHEWVVSQYNRDGTVMKSQPVAKLTTEEMLPNYKHGKRNLYTIDNAAPLEGDDRDVDVDPYVLGFWLGDGDSNHSRITTSSQDVDHVVGAFVQAGHNVDVKHEKRNPNVKYLRVDMKPIEGDTCFRGHDKRISGFTSNGYCAECSRQNHMKRKHGDVPDPIKHKHDGLRSKLAAMGLLVESGCAKRIPMNYLRGSRRQRLALLQGLMDSDGTCDARSGGLSFTSTRYELVSGVCELVVSLGLRATISSRQTYSHTKNGRTKGAKSWDVRFHAYNDLHVFRLSRKLKLQRPKPIRRYEENTRRRITKIEQIPTRPVKCIRVKNESHLFLAGRSMIPTHNTQGLIDGGIGYIITCDPSDMLVIHMTEEAARRYSRLRVKRMLNNSPDLKAKLSTSTHDDNILGKYFRNGTALILGYPSPTQLSAQDYKYVFLSDYDRMPDDNGEGDIYSQAMKRTQTFMSGGMCVVESSPGRDFTDTSWKPKSIHEAPPVGGILALYNSGDRRLWFWTCPECDEPFPCTPGLELFNLPEQEELIKELRENGSKQTAEKYNYIVCPECGSELKPEQKNKMNLAGFWKAESDRANSIASFWLGGVAAKFQTWLSLLEKEFNALIHFDDTGEESKLKATRNTDQGLPYIPVGASEKMSAEELEKRAEDLPKRVIPQGARFLMASVDVQSNKFVVQIQAFGIKFESWVIDRYDIAISDRESHGEMAILDPAGHKEDWHLLIDRVILQRYAVDDKSGRTMGVLMTTCDSGGKEGVTENAYSFWKHVKKEGLADRFNLIKGERPRPTVNKPMVSKSIPDKSSSAARKAKVVGDMPLWLLNTTLLKDAVSSNLKRIDAGGDYIHFPDWLPSWFYAEVVAENRTAKGWENPSSARNESFDLLCYAKAGLLIKLDSYWKKEINWENPPPWAEVWDNNSEVSDVETGSIQPRIRTARRVRMRVRK